MKIIIYQFYNTRLKGYSRNYYKTLIQFMSLFCVINRPPIFNYRLDLTARRRYADLWIKMESCLVPPKNVVVER